jgi:Domain of unknown function (DUF4440)
MDAKTDPAVAELRQRELERCRAISVGDWVALGDLLREDYSHSHSDGVVQDKAVYLEFIRGRPRTTSRPDLRVRVYGDVAIMNGRQVNTYPPEAGRAPVVNEVMQVWVRGDGAWRMAAFQSSRVAAQR